MYVHDRNFFFAELGNSIKTELLKMREHYAGVARWFDHSKPISVILIRNDLATKEEAFESAFEVVSGLCDLYAMLSETTPDISPLLKTREGDAVDGDISLFYIDRGKLRFNSNDGEAERRWNTRTLALLKMFLPCFDVAAGTLPATELTEQMRLSLRMFRHALSAPAVGIEFLCKFSALEGLVCGSALGEKHKLLKKRIGCLMRGTTDWNAEVTALWKLRCSASHQSAAFSTKFIPATGSVDHIFLAVMVFAAHHINYASGIDELWTRASAYTLPAEALQTYEVLHGRIVRAVVPTPLKWLNLGLLIDKQFQEFA